VTLDIETMGNLFRERRRSLKLKQREVAERMGSTQSHIAQIERGARSLRWFTILEMARVLELEPVLVPRESLPAVNALLGAAKDTSDAPPLIGEEW
jgi:HTH-type transcriptional regulator/antitoxin HipB